MLILTAYRQDSGSEIAKTFIWRSIKEVLVVSDGESLRMVEKMGATETFQSIQILIAPRPDRTRPT